MRAILTGNFVNSQGQRVFEYKHLSSDGRKVVKGGILVENVDAAIAKLGEFGYNEVVVNPNAHILTGV